MYSIVDIESNGGPYRKENIIEIAIYRYDGHEVVDQFISLVNPESDITSFVQKLTGISPNMVKTAPKFHEIAKRIIEITQNSTLVGHNIEFDYRMLRQSFKRLGYDFKINTLDTIPLAKKLIPEEKSYSLSKLCKSIGIPLSEAHRASGDARATLDLLKLLITKDKDHEIIQSQFEESKAINYTNKIKELTEDLPADKGIIYFQNKDGKIIFHDLVDNIYKVAKKVFNSNAKKYKAIQQNVEQINYELTGNEVIAQLIMKTKNLSKVQKLGFGLFYQNGKYNVEKFTKESEPQPILKFKSYTQGLKALSFLKHQEDLQDLVNLTQKINLKTRNEIWTSSGRQLGEKVFIVFEKGKLKGFGFYELYHQIKTLDKIKKLMIPVSSVSPYLKNELQLSLLRGDFEIQVLPEK
ncbi:3'-5' exonuclease [Chryseobacterium sp. POL2]|uniref:3'-5' exonuclease n=1 Tax=Chryseobacterium sp. POL2 TaxID=2713414 RepID=UPI0013E1DDF1|nr:3'-5' exonuclease [Chryseobacterium sp. POL2]QIG90060.1 3'-5' exonuclease [Chryseobacterium sp. POL2]